jgi:hypothetical protein
MLEPAVSAMHRSRDAASAQVPDRQIARCELSQSDWF